MQYLKKHWYLVVITLLTIGLGVMVILTSGKLSQRKEVAPTVPQEEPRAVAPACSKTFTIHIPTGTPTPTPTNTPTPTPPYVYNTPTPTPTPPYVYNTPTPTPTPPTAPQCIAMKIYKNDVLLSDADLTTLQWGDILTLALTPSGAATKAHFRVSGGSWIETTTKNSSGEFILNWTIPSGVTTVTMDGEIFDGTNWY